MDKRGTMLRNLCKHPECIDYVVIGKEYCRKHLKELELKSEMYLKELTNEKR
jgi:hypothetical protein